MANYYSLSYTGAETNTAVRKALNASILIFQNIDITTDAWSETSPYDIYPYKATAECTGCDTNLFPEVVFNLNDVLSGYFAPICNSVFNGVEIYASDIPAGTIRIPTIKCTGTIS